MLIENADDLRIVVSVLLRPFAIVQVDQHVRQELVKSVFNRVCRLLGLVSLPIVVVVRLLLVGAVGLVLVLVVLAWLLLIVTLSWIVLPVRAVLVMLLLVLGLVALISIVLLSIVVLLLVTLGVLLILLILARLIWLTLILLILTTLTILGLRGLVLIGPLVLIFNLIAEVILVTFFRAVDTLLLSVLIFALLFSLLVIGIDPHVVHTALSLSLWLPRLSTP